MANGRVCTGFSNPRVATYSASGSTVTYSNGQPLARGVSVSLSVESSDDNPFYADNRRAEGVPGTFTGGEATVTVDGLLKVAEKLILGLPTPSTVTVGTSTVDMYDYGEAMTPPYVGLGFIVRYMSDGVESYDAVMLTKCRFAQPSDAAETAEETINWQTQELVASIFRDDTSAHNWKRVSAPQTSEAAAQAVLEALLPAST